MPESAEFISGLIGTKTVLKATERIKTSYGIFGPDIDMKTGDKSVREVEEFIIHPNVFKNLPIGECVMISKYPYPMSQVLTVKSEDKLKYLSNTEMQEIMCERSAVIPRITPYKKKVLKENSETDEPTRPAVSRKKSKKSDDPYASDFV